MKAASYDGGQDCEGLDSVTLNPCSIRFGPGADLSYEITLTRIDEASVRVVIVEQGLEPMLDRVVPITALRNYRKEGFTDGTLEVSYMHYRDRACLKFTADDGRSRRLALLRAPFELLLEMGEARPPEPRS